MPPAARITDMHTCPVHGGGPDSSGSPDVIVGFLPAARVGDTLICPPAVDVIAMGSVNVLINSRNAARIGDPTAHGGVVVVGCPTVIIGQTPQASALSAASARGTPFCEECEKAKKAAEEQAAAAAASPEPQPPPDSVTMAMMPPPAPPAAAAAPAPPAAAPPLTPYTPTEFERQIAAQPGNTPVQRHAREKVLRDFYERYAGDGLGQARADQDMGVGGNPPRPNGKPVGYGIDLSMPMQVISFPPPDTMDQYVRHVGYAGNFFDPIGGQSGDAVGLNDDPAIRKARTWKMPPAEGLFSGNGPVVDDWTDQANPVKTKGGGVQVTVPDSVKLAVRCVCCGKNPCPR